ncbi:MaoC family dehydratase [Salipiger aestuarii]|uniref:MaoC family dehydratase n=1 Tax=Salipiger aestuarii TaxID=568098 RepID=UPI001CC282A2|nr:MaoC family dehydratase [Salipiger aestuarii]
MNDQTKPVEGGSPVTLDITSEVIGKYADITNDYNPIHTDPEFAATTPMKGVIAHGTMSLALIWQALRRDFGAARCARAALDVRFIKPVRINDRLTARHQPDDLGGLSVWVENQNGESVIKGSARL